MKTITLSLIALLTTSVMAVDPAIIQPIDPGELQPADLQVDPEVLDNLVFEYVVPSLSIPYEFVAGEVAKASEVNANFTKVKESVDGNSANIANLMERMSGIATVYKEVSDGLTDNYRSVLSLTLNVPADGYVHLIATGNIEVSEIEPNKIFKVNVGVSGLDGIAPTIENIVQAHQDESSASMLFYGTPYMAQGIMYAEKGEHTYYIIATSLGSTTGHVILTRNRLTATYYPTLLAQ